MDILSQQRFTRPDQFEIHFFQTESGDQIRYGFLPVKGSTHTIIIFPGLFEFIEKYYEAMRDFAARGLSVAVLDWPSQGKSQRYLPNSNKRHSLGFGYEAEIAKEWIEQVLARHDSLPQRRILLGHSFGGHMACRILIQFPALSVDHTILSAPLISPYIRPKWLKAITPAITHFMCLAGQQDQYILGGRDWSYPLEESIDKSALSHDPIRKHIYHIWYEKDPALICNSMTWFWLKELFASCRYIQSHRQSLKDRDITFLISRKDIWVEAEAAQKLAATLEKESYIFEGAYHELLMEADPYRIQFFKAFDEIVK